MDNVDYLTNRTQFVKLSSTCRSQLISSNTGAPQGTVLAPFLFTLYTADCRSSEEMCPLIKFADDTALAGLIHADDEGAYLRQLQSFVEYCDSNFLQLNTSKTKEMLIDFRRTSIAPLPVVIKGEEVERVHSYKYLGVTLNDVLSWGDHVDILMKKLNSRLYCLRKMANFNVRSVILDMFYKATICGVWRYCLVCWGGNVAKKEKDRIDGVIKRAERVIGVPQPAIDSVYQELLQAKLEDVWDDGSHPLHHDLHDNRIKRGVGRIRLPQLKTNRHRNSFIPRAIKLFNDALCR